MCCSAVAGQSRSSRIRMALKQLVNDAIDHRSFYTAHLDADYHGFALDYCHELLGAPMARGHPNQGAAAREQQAAEANVLAVQRREEPMEVERPTRKLDQDHHWLIAPTGAVRRVRAGCREGLGLGHLIRPSSMHCMLHSLQILLHAL